jgi:hypothetical protein
MRLLLDGNSTGGERGMSFWSSTLRRGRKDHRCESCRRTINAGEESYDEAGMWEGTFQSYRLCPPCRKFINRLYAAGEIEDGYSFMDLPDMAREINEPWPPVLVETANPEIQS